jgi:hypothetical protein
MLAHRPQNGQHRQISGPPVITCVDWGGNQVPVTELWHGPAELVDHNDPDDTDPELWPATYEIDGVNWEISDGIERAALEREATEAMLDAADAARAWYATQPSFEQWLEMEDR